LEILANLLDSRFFKHPLLRKYTALVNEDLTATYSRDIQKWLLVAPVIGILAGLIITAIAVLVLDVIWAALLPYYLAHHWAIVVGLVAGFTLFALGYVGGGDAKLFAATALAFGLHDLLDYAVVASVFGGVLTLSLLAARKIPLPRLFAAQGWILRLHDEREGIPYGVALALGALVLLPHTEFFRLATGG